MDENAIDVICPVYNAENTISRCIDSVLAQRHQNWKLILVDDGSTDNSAEIIKKYVNDYPDKICYFYQENAGPSAARNNGIEKGSSPYICFVDADDFIDEDWLESFNLGASKNADIVFNGFMRTRIVNGELKDTNVFYSIIKSLDHKKKDVLSKFARLDSFLRAITISSLFKREIIEKNGLKFDQSLSLSEDLSFKYDYLSFCEDIVCMPCVGYHYVYNSSSLVNVKRQTTERLYIYSLIFRKERTLLKRFGYNMNFDMFSKKVFLVGSFHSIVNSSELSYKKKYVETTKVLLYFLGVFSYVLSPFVLIGLISYKNRRFWGAKS